MSATGHLARPGRNALVAAAGALLLASPAAASARPTARSAGASAKQTCNRAVPRSAAASALGVAVKASQVRKGLEITLGHRENSAFECAFYPSHPTYGSGHDYPASEPVAFITVLDGRATSSQLRQLIKADALTGEKAVATKLPGFGGSATLTAEPGELGTFTEGGAAFAPRAILFVLKAHTLFYADSDEVPQANLEAFARGAAAHL
jgi:hypothetical protein